MWELLGGSILAIQEDWERGLRGRMCPFTGNSEKLLKGSSVDGASLSMRALLREPRGGAPCGGTPKVMKGGL
jgi:hypothetical protein